MYLSSQPWTTALNRGALRPLYIMWPSFSQKEILVSSVLPKNELENVNFCPSLLGQKFFISFCGELKNQKALSKLTDL